MTAVLPETWLARIEVPEPITAVVVEMFALGATVHAVFDETSATCGLATWPFWTVPIGRALRLHPEFCPGCFPPHSHNA